MYLRQLFPMLLLGLLLTGCSIATLAPADTLSDEARGRDLLRLTYEKMGYDRLEEATTYSVTANFDWATGWSMMPMNALPGNKNHDIRFHFATNTFDGQVEFLEGPREGRTYGLQSWETYRQDDPAAPAETISSKRYPWGLATYHYLTEAPLRLLEAEVVRYAGTTRFDGQEYDRVFVTWGDGTDRKNYDQWLVYVNRQTGFTDLVEVTITDFFLPMPGGMKNATVRFAERVETTIGTWLPARTVIQLGRPKEQLERDVYTFTFRDFAFDEFPRERLYPLPGRREFGDSKPVGK